MLLGAGTKRSRLSSPLIAGKALLFERSTAHSFSGSAQTRPQSRATALPMSLRTSKVSASFSGVLRELSGSCGKMATRRPPWAGTVQVTLLAKAGVPAPARAAAMKIEASINAPSWPFGNYLLQPHLLVVRIGRAHV